MWIFANDAFLSIVAHRNPKWLTVRARRMEDLCNVFPDARVKATPNRDYQFRAIISRKAVEKAMVQETRRITYDNFKNSIEDEERHDACSQIWSVMMRWSQGLMKRRATDPLYRHQTVYHGNAYDHDPDLADASRWRAHEKPLSDDLENL